MSPHPPKQGQRCGACCQIHFGAHATSVGLLGVGRAASHGPGSRESRVAQQAESRV